MPDLMPDKFRLGYDVSMYMHDYLARLLVEGQESKLFDTSFSVSGAEEQPRQDEEDLLLWLERNGRHDVLGELLYKAVFPALLSDFCHFLFEALSCTRKGKLTVAFALLRKPLRESLHYMEWLLADPAELLNTLYNEEPTTLAIKGDAQRMQGIIEKALSRCENSPALDAELLYRLRYDKAFDGFDGMCNQAMHLITTKHPINTLKQNFNFIFSTWDDMESQWDFMFRNLPLVLFYACDVVTALTRALSDQQPAHMELESLRKAAGFTAWCASLVGDGGGGHAEVDSPPAKIEATCSHCSAELELTKTNLLELFYECVMRCKNCGKDVSLQELVDANG